MNNEILIWNLDFNGLGIHRSKGEICFFIVELILFPSMFGNTHFSISSAFIVQILMHTKGVGMSKSQ